MHITKVNALLITLSCVTFFFISSCGSSDEDIEEPMIDEEIEMQPDDKPNILLIIADDMGVDATNGYAEGTVKPNTPHLDSLMSAGLKFTNCWVNPTCTPTRASIITGKYGSATNVLEVGNILPNQEELLQSYINSNTDNAYGTAVIGKWHLAGSSSFNPESLGIDYYTGILSGAVNNYYSWALSENGNSLSQSDYVTEKLTNLSIDWVENQTKPWFLWLAYNAPHTPFHVPPSEMHSQGGLPTDQGSIDTTPLPYYLAAIEAMDYQIGRLLDSMDSEERENTVLIFIGDNGTPGMVAQSPFSRRRAKGSLYQGGVNVPLFVTGPAVSRTGTDESLINGTDLFATISAIAGVEAETVNDSKNFKSLLELPNVGFRDFIFAETLNSWTVRNEQYKLLQNEGGDQEFYDLQTDPYENDNLLIGNGISGQQETIRQSLEAHAVNIRD